jgi:hypothetical protein
LALRLIPLFASIVGLKKLGKLGRVYRPGQPKKEDRMSDPFATADVGKTDEELDSPEEIESISEIMNRTFENLKNKSKEEKMAGIAGFMRKYTNEEIDAQHVSTKKPKRMQKMCRVSLSF